MQQRSEPAGTAASAGEALARARAVAPLLAAAGDRIEAARALPADVLEALHEARLFRLLLPRSLGGDELDFPTLAAVTEEIAASDASTAWCLGQGAGCAMSAAALAPEVAREVFGPREAVLAWGAGAAGTAKPVEGGWLVDGTWTFASGIRHATWVGAHCRVLEADGTPRLASDGRPLERTALVPRDAVEIADVWQVMGLAGTGSDSYTLRARHVPAHAMIDRELGAQVHEAGPLYRLTGTQAYPAAFGGVMLGIARGALADLGALAMTKTPRGASSSLRESPVFQTDLARMTARWRAARAYHHHTYRELWGEAVSGRPITLEARMRARLAATHAINEALAIVVEAYRNAGQTAIFTAHPFERRLRDALTASQQVQGRASHYTTVGRHLLGVDAGGGLFI
jgi:alkylation response protein AidB-like acyl-CoA dehydrogenase